MASIWDIITGEGSKYVKEAITGLLGESGIADRAKYASGLLDADSPISRDAQAWHQRTQLGLQDQLAGKDTPAAKEAYANLMNMAGNAPIGMIKAPRAEAMRIAQQNAAKPVSEGGLGLGPNNTPMERAKAMGIDTPAVHFSRHGVDVNELDSGKYAVAPFDAVGTHVGTEAAAADRFANTVGYKVNDPKYANDELKGVSYPLLIRKGKEMLDESGKPFSESPLSLDWSSKADYGNLREYNKALRDDIFSKYDSVPYVNDVESAGEISYIVHPRNIRSRFAAFDPARRMEADLLGNADPRLLGLIAGGGLLGAAAYKE